MLNETGEQIEFTPKELKWWTFKFIFMNPIYSIKAWWKGLGNDW